MRWEVRAGDPHGKMATVCEALSPSCEHPKRGGHRCSRGPEQEAGAERDSRWVEGSGTGPGAVALSLLSSLKTAEQRNPRRCVSQPLPRPVSVSPSLGFRD